jgi:TctA family transporter
MLVSRGDPLVFFTRPISLSFIILTVVIIVGLTMPSVRKRRGNISG